jgi:hypothetical protein
VDNKEGSQSEEAAEGTRAHVEAEKIAPLGHIPDKLEYEIEEYLNHIWSLEGEYYFEDEVRLASISDEIYGTADCIVVDRWDSKLYIVDLKYGANVLVEVAGNAQLATYGLGALEKFGDNFDEIHLTIVQPRINHKDGPVRTWKTTPKNLRKIWYPKIKKAFETAIAKPKLFREGNHCKWCSGCWECTKATNTTAAIERAQRKGEKISKENKKLAKILCQEQMVLEYFNTVKAMAWGALIQGETIPGFKLVKSFSRNRIWKIHPQDLVSEFDLGDDAYTQKIKSPAQMEKSKILTKEQIAEHVYHPYKGLKMVPEDDKRPAHRSAIKDFDDEVSQLENGGNK